MGAPLFQDNRMQNLKEITPRVKQSGEKPTIHRSISETGIGWPPKLSKTTQTEEPNVILEQACSKSDLEVDKTICKCCKRTACNDSNYFAQILKNIMTNLCMIVSSPIDMQERDSIRNLQILQDINYSKHQPVSLDDTISKKYLDKIGKEKYKAYDKESLHLDNRKGNPNMLNGYDKNGFFENELSKVFKDLLRLRTFPQVPHYMEHFTLEQYFNSFSNGACSMPGEIMSNELLRLSSLRTFPRDIDISMTRLAQTGFYQHGEPGVTKCFSCGVIYRNWKSGDNPIDIHRRLSPECSLVCNNSATPPSDVQNSISVGNNNMPSTFRSSHGGPNINEINSTSSITQNNAATISSSVGVTSETNQCINSHLPSTQNFSEQNNSSTQTFQNNNVNASPRNELSENLPSNHQSNNNGGFATLGINIDKPKYPNYATLQTRISSYKGWPSYLDQTPRDMAIAGFLFAGYNDYTRCFFCGGGLRNWEAGDDPWVEHARWFPKCPFLKQIKGERFIQAVMKKQQEVEQETAQRNEPSAQQSIPPSTSEATSYPANSSVTEHDQLRSIASRSVLEMGYSREQVLGALRKIDLKQHGFKEVSATDIMRTILDEDDEDVASQGATGHVIKEKRSESKEVSEALPELFGDVETQALMDENQQLRDQRLCKVCFDLEATIAFLPCGHIVCCSDCAPAMRKCPLCRTFIKGTVKTYLA